MIEEKAIVVAVKHRSVELSTSVKTTCNGCSAQEGCGTGLMARFLAPKPDNLILETDLDLKVGQKVVIGLAESAVLKMAFLSYIFPIFVIIGVVLLTQSLQPTSHELFSIVVAAAGLAIYFIALKHWLANHVSPAWRPVIIKPLPLDIETPLVQLNS